MTHFINPKLTDRENQILKGTILGGSSVIKPSGGKNCYLSMRSKDGQWLDYKALELRNLSSQEPMTIEKTNRWHSLCYPLFNKLRKEFWKDNKRILLDESLNDLGWVGLMIWFVDCGTYKGGNVILNTHIWGQQGTDVLKNYLNCCGYKGDIVLERKNFRIKLDNGSSYNFVKSISPHLPRFMAVKISANLE